MTEPSFWSDPEMFSSGDFVSFEQVGDTVTGTILGMRRHVFDDGKIVPQIELDTANGPKTLTAGQIRLKAELAEKRPGVGDLLTVTLTEIEKRAGGKTLKHFKVTVGPVAATPTPAAEADPQVAAALAGLTPEMRAALLNMNPTAPAAAGLL
jgi:hypothetical protein